MQEQKKMLEEHCEGDIKNIRALNPVAFYFGKAKEMELHQGYLHFLSRDAKEMYGRELEEIYDVLFDRIMTSSLSPFFKQEVEQWYGFNRDFLGFCDTAEMNRELEDLLGKFELL